MSNVFFAQSQAVFHYETRQLRNRLREAWVSAQHGRRKPPTLKKCREMLADEYGYGLSELSVIQELTGRFVERNLMEGKWINNPYPVWRPGIYYRQLKALQYALEHRMPVQQAASKHGVTFAGFHFSDLLMCKLSQHYRLRYLDLSGLIAPFSMIHDLWTVPSFENADLRHARFYQTYCDPSVSPGVVAADTNFDGADLRHADFRLSYLARSSFSRARVDGTDFRGAVMTRTRLMGATGRYLEGERRGNRDWFIFE
ncbi:pentapeptide repeat-containing protein [Pseudomonas fakonensis]|uniref:Pentapeptide repeat-containing protein n=1 Tax=Pseudomonas fakonensis TaxID=2842355 RepID=A0ABX8NBS0_9PSED|nr:pentapeptide repeat-containing protein [Pseudomonas fakonensis]QXH53320.1 pentapeptide repeat-containing protein [Pseudomonas fakonensis]